MTKSLWSFGVHSLNANVNKHSVVWKTQQPKILTNPLRSTSKHSHLYLVWCASKIGCDFLQQLSAGGSAEPVGDWSMYVPRFCQVRIGCTIHPTGWRPLGCLYLNMNLAFRRYSVDKCFCSSLPSQHWSQKCVGEFLSGSAYKLVTGNQAYTCAKSVRTSATLRICAFSEVKGRSSLTYLPASIPTKKTLRNSNILVGRELGRESALAFGISQAVCFCSPA